MLEFLIIAVIALVTWCVASEGAWSAALMCLCVIFSGLLAMNYFEPFAEFLEGFFSSSKPWIWRWDFISLVSLFILFVFLFRTVAEQLSPRFISLNSLVYDLGRWGFGALTGYVTMAFFLTALHTAPFPQDFMGFTSEPSRRAGIIGPAAPDFQWLGFTQFVSEKIFRRDNGGRVFDGPQFEKGDFKGLWSSFPLRYAMQRYVIEANVGSAPPSDSTDSKEETDPEANDAGRNRDPR